MTPRWLVGGLTLMSAVLVVSAGCVRLSLVAIWQKEVRWPFAAVDLWKRDRVPTAWAQRFNDAFQYTLSGLKLMFDPYRKWLGILPKDQPPNHYRLLSLEQFEDDLDVIEGAADRQMGFIRQYQAGEHAMLAAKLLNEIAAARLCLLKPASKAEYDAKLRKEQAVAAPAHDDTPDFASDPDVAQMVKSAPQLPRTKRSKARSNQTVYIAGGAVALIVIVLLATNRPGGRAPAPDPERTQTTSSVASPTAPAEPSVASSKSPVNPVSNSNTLTSNPSPTVTPSVVPVAESKPPADATGPSIDLLQRADLNFAANAGEWKRQGTSLIGGHNARIQFPVRAPDEYQLEYRLKRIVGNDCCWIGIPVSGRMGVMVFDADNSTYSGLYVDGKHAKENSTVYYGSVFANDRFSSLILVVHPKHFRATVDGKTIIDWYGNPERFFIPNYFGIANTESPVFANHDSFQVDSAILTPIKPEVETPHVARFETVTDLIPMLNMARDVIHGVWSLDQSVLSSPGNFAQIYLPTEVPAEYTITANVERPADTKGDSQLGIGLIAGNAQFQVVPFNGAGLGVEVVDQEIWTKNETSLFKSFQLGLGEKGTIAFTVTKEGIRYDFNGHTLIDWRGDFRRMEMPANYCALDARKLWLATHSNYKIREIKIGPPVDPPVKINKPSLVAGRPFDLLPLIEPQRDSISGTWVKDGAKIKTMADAPISNLVISCEIPAEYKLTLRVAREPGGGSNNDALSLKLPVGTSMSQLFLDTGSSTISGFCVDKRSADDPRNPTVFKGAAIPSSGVREYAIVVRKTGLKVMLGTKSIIDWQGNSDRLMTQPGWGSPSGQIAIGCRTSRFRFEKLAVEPVDPSSYPDMVAPDSSGNLMPILDAQRDSRQGEWRIEQGAVVSPASSPARLRIATALPKQYSVSLSVERIAGDDAFMFGMVVDGHSCALIIDGAAGSQSGISMLDGNLFYEDLNLTRRRHSRLLPNRQSVNIKCTVLTDSLLVHCGGSELVRWHGDARRLSPASVNQPPNYCQVDDQNLWLGAWESVFQIRDLALKPISDDEANQIRNTFSGVFPVTSQANVPLR